MERNICCILVGTFLLCSSVSRLLQQSGLNSPTVVPDQSQKNSTPFCPLILFLHPCLSSLLLFLMAQEPRELELASPGQRLRYSQPGEGRRSILCLEVLPHSRKTLYLWHALRPLEAGYSPFPLLYIHSYKRKITSTLKSVSRLMSNALMD